LQGRREWRERGFSVLTRLAAGLSGEQTTWGLGARGLGMRRRGWGRWCRDWGCGGGELGPSRLGTAGQDGATRRRRFPTGAVGRQRPTERARGPRENRGQREREREYARSPGRTSTKGPFGTAPWTAPGAVFCASPTKRLRENCSRGGATENPMTEGSTHNRSRKLRACLAWLQLQTE
jgi:hypothetical protein